MYGVDNGRNLLRRSHNQIQKGWLTKILPNYKYDFLLSITSKGVSKPWLPSAFSYENNP